MPENRKSIIRKLNVFQMRSILTFLCCATFALTSQVSYAQRPQIGDELCINRDNSIRYIEANVAIKNATCPTSRDGSICVAQNLDTDILYDRGRVVPPFTFFWYYESDAPIQTQNGCVTGLRAGRWTLVIRDSRQICSRNFAFDVLADGNITNAITDPVRGTTCFGGSDGAIYFQPNGNSDANERQPYEIFFSNVSNGNSKTEVGVMEGQTVSFENLPADTFVVLVRDAKGCENAFGYRVRQPQALSLNFQPLNETCREANNASMILRINGGLGGEETKEIELFREDPRKPFPIPQPLVTNADSVQNLSVLWNNTASIDLRNYYALQAGDYWVRVRETVNHGCNVVAPFTVREPLALSVVASTTMPNCGEQPQGTYNNGTISLTVAGGTPPYAVDWADVQDGRVEPLVPGDNIPGDPTFLRRLNLTEGTYSVTIHDANGCQVQSDVNVAAPSGITVGVAVTDVTCSQYNDGTATLTIVGGTAPYKTVWTYGQPNNPPLNVPMDVTRVTELLGGTYYVTVTDAKGCSQTESFTVTDLRKGGTGNVKADIQNVSCFGTNDGQITLTVSGRVVAQAVLSTGQNAARLSDDIFQFSKLPAATYQVVAYEAGPNGERLDNCFTTHEWTVTQPEKVTFTVDVKDKSCKGINAPTDGEIHLNVWGGTPFTNRDATAGNYDFCIKYYETNVIDPKATCNNLPLGAQIVINNNHFAATNLQRGYYLLSVSDSKGCVSILDTVMVGEPATELQVKIDIVQQVLCNSLNDNPFDGNRQGFTGKLFANTQSFPYQGQPSGTPPYRYFWSLPQGMNPDSLWYYERQRSNAEYDELPAGRYTIYVVDANGCQASAETTLVAPPALNLSLARISTPSSCTVNDAIVQVNYGGGTGILSRYEVTWSPMPPLSAYDPVARIITNLTFGTYRVTVRDENGCKITKEIEISSDKAGIVGVIPTVTPVSCNGGNNGAIAIVPVGGRSPYRFSFRSVQSGQIVNANIVDDKTGRVGDLIAGDYDVFIKDSDSCRYYRRVTVPQPEKLEIIETVKNVDCFNQNNGQISVTAVGGNGDYTYRWAPSGERTSTITNKAAGLYSVTVTDAKGCMVNMNIMVDQPEKLEVMPHQKNVSCNGKNDAWLVAHTMGGTMPYGYNWSIKEGNQWVTLNANTDTVSNLAPGEYRVVTTDAKNCEVTTNYTVTQPDVLTFGATSATPTRECGTATGSVTVGANGGQRPFIYNLVPVGSNDAVASISSLDNRVTFANVLAGTYNVRITDYNGCNPVDATAPITVGEPIRPTVTATKVRDALCNNTTESDFLGIATATATNCSNCSFAWYDATPGAPTLPVETGATVRLSAGSYYVVAINRATNCRDTANVVINQPIPLAVKMTVVQPILCFNDNNAILRADVSGGVGTYSYQFTRDRDIVQPFGPNNRLENVRPGEYFISVRDANGCLTLDRALILEPVIMLTNVSNVKGAVCYGDENGSFDVVVTGGRKRYKVELITSTSRVIRTLFTEDDITNPFRNLKADQYTIRVSDYEVSLKGDTTYYCVYDRERAIVPDGPFYELTSHNADINCSGRGAQYTAVLRRDNQIVSESELSLYTFAWVGGTAGARPNQRNFSSPGVATLTVTDSRGCNKSFQITVRDNAFNPEVIGRNCTGVGEVVVRNVGGIPPFRYTLNAGQPNQVELTTFNNTVQFTNLTPGATYTFNGVDGAGCTANPRSVTVPAESLNVVVNIRSNVTCRGGNDGVATVTVGGGKSPFVYAWSHDVAVSSPTAINLPAGTFSVTVTDANGCSIVKTGTVAEPPNMLIINARVQNQSTCVDKNGSIVLSIEGGQPPYAFEWSKDGKVISTNRDLFNLEAGTYIGRVRDAGGCVKVANVEVKAPDAPRIVNASVTQLICRDAKTASIDITVDGGARPYSFSWSNGATTEDLFNIGAGTYTGTITDANGCVTVSNPVTIMNPPGASITETTTPVSACGATDGAIDITVTGGEQPYRYNWSNGATTEDLSNVASNDYTVTVTDAKGCQTIKEIYVGQPNLIDLSRSIVTNISCNGQTDGSIVVVISPNSTGVPPYTYRWSTGQETTELSGLAAGRYTVTVTDAEGCYRIRTFTIVEPAKLGVANLILNHVTCNGTNDGSIVFEVVGGTAPFSFEWSNGARTQNLVGLSGGSYSGVITDSRGCQFNTGDLVINEPAVLATTFNVTRPDCRTGNNGRLEAVVTGGTAPYTYAWNTGDNSATLLNLRAGDYTITITDAKGCSIVRTQKLETTPFGVAPTIRVTPPSANNSYCVLQDTTDQNFKILVIAEVQGSQQGVTYKWNTGEATATVAIPRNVAGVYKLFCTVTLEGCGQANTPEVTVTVLDQPTAPVIVQKGDTLMTTTEYAKYQWIRVTDVDSAVIAGATERTYVFDSTDTPGAYYVRVENEAGCSNVSNRITWTSVAGKLNTLPLALYPNPTNGIVSLQATFTHNAEVTITVYNNLGQAVMVQKAVPQTGSVDVNLSNLTSGVYNIRVLSGDKLWVGKVVKE